MEEAKEENPKPGPVFQKRLGSIRVAVFRNKGQKGSEWFNTRIVRQWRQGEQFREAPTFNGLADLALVEEAVRYAKEFINQQALAA